MSSLEASCTAACALWLHTVLCSSALRGAQSGLRCWALGTPQNTASALSVQPRCAAAARRRRRLCTSGCQSIQQWQCSCRVMTALIDSAALQGACLLEPDACCGCRVKASILQPSAEICRRTGRKRCTSPQCALLPWQLPDSFSHGSHMLTLHWLPVHTHLLTAPLHRCDHASTSRTKPGLHALLTSLSCSEHCVQTSVCCSHHHALPRAGAHRWTGCTK